MPHMVAGTGIPALCIYFDWLATVATTDVPHWREHPQVDAHLLDRMAHQVVPPAQGTFYGTRDISRLLVSYLGDGVWGARDPATVQLPLLASVSRLVRALYGHGHCCVINESFGVELCRTFVGFASTAVGLLEDASVLDQGLRRDAVHGAHVCLVGAFSLARSQVPLVMGVDGALPEYGGVLSQLYRVMGRLLDVKPVPGVVMNHPVLNAIRELRVTWRRNAARPVDRDFNGAPARAGWGGGGAGGEGGGGGGGGGAAGAGAAEARVTPTPPDTIPHRPDPAVFESSDSSDSTEPYDTE